MNFRPYLAAFLATALVACASAPTPTVQRNERLPAGLLRMS